MFQEPDTLLSIVSHPTVHPRPGLYTRFDGYIGFYVALWRRGPHGEAQLRVLDELDPAEYPSAERALEDCFFFLRDRAPDRERGHRR